MPSPPGPADAVRLARSYALNQLCYQAAQDPRLRADLQTDPEATLEGLPLSADERGELLAGDIRALYDRGVHPLLLVRLATLELFGLDLDNYGRRLRAAPEPAPTKETGP
ncbi:hypothetical protein [Streptomyces tailanensis]|uniref:hypothetical protein n=1 Tax=Streptomyces tailanensis TaxID=2569858 RepID=UPI00122DDE51|nr:hypothetical protein [Streptomyces tailanensis]